MGWDVLLAQLRAGEVLYSAFLPAANTVVVAILRFAASYTVDLDTAVIFVHPGDMEFTSWAQARFEM